MNLPAIFDCLPSAPSLAVTGKGWTGMVTLALAGLAAFTFTGYLLRCYLQEFRRKRRIARRKRLCRLKTERGLLLEARPDREAVEEGCLGRRKLVLAGRAAASCPEIDWHGLHCLIPSRDRITLVWDSGRTHAGALPRLEAQETRAQVLKATCTSDGAR